MCSLRTVGRQTALFSLGSLALAAAISPLPTLAGGRRSERPLAEELLRGTGSVNHPVGMPYVRRETDRRGSSLRHASLLAREVRLLDGRVSCVSCQNLCNVLLYRLSVPIESARLCLTCLDMD